jgi:predicted nucleic acid-binding protein
MIILDTNVVSELMKPAPDRKVLKWVAEQPDATLYTTSITQAEILHGVLLLPAGRRRNAVKIAAESMFNEDFAGRILAFESEAAAAYAALAVERRRAGRPISHFDAQICAIARSTGAAIATRNVSDFDGCGVKVVDPWAAS